LWHGKPSPWLQNDRPEVKEKKMVLWKGSDAPMFAYWPCYIYVVVRLSFYLVQNSSSVFLGSQPTGISNLVDYVTAFC